MERLLTRDARPAPERGVWQGSRAAPRWLLGTLPGAWVALLFACLSFTPSLLPRTGAFQGFVSGVSAVIGYGLGVLGAWLWREFAHRPARTPRPRAWRFFFIAGGVALVAALLLGFHWQRHIRELMGMPHPGSAGYVFAPVIAAFVFFLLLTLGRGLRAVHRALDARLARHIGPRAARAMSVLAVVALTFLVASGLMKDGLLGMADRSLALRDLTTEEGVVPPSTALRSGGPGSQVEWESLGREGRNFVGRGPSVQQLTAFAGTEAKEPIRVYAGYASAQDAEGRAELAVRELERTGAFQRAHLLVVTTTGSGWVVPQAVEAFEYVTGGDSAIVATQYSHLWSWLSVLVDQKKARKEGRALFDAVYERWSKLPEGQRPKLLVFGESLGSYGGETAFSGERDLANRTDGALFVGPPNFNTLYREFTDQRDAGSPEVEPIYRQGRTVRFSRRPGEVIPPADAPWGPSRVLYLLHPSDPITWWSPSLMVKRPDWLREPRGPDVLGAMVWIPFVTFWQVTADLPLGLEVPSGYGHVYTGEHVDGWVALVQPQGWDDGKSARLRRLLEREP
ncbi:alpha/beta-hydrolase family protein [Corallococcus sp. BB11-1]|uniref:alpha/beta hydrolase n=1 Tax=Corallococcus sp. BB11-1 TaxID=2996783 RepID=UPI002270020D|nr:alpha/beta-hydrolase family protein [Corallococcus sp. BB11-1]MCY1036594.1 alpha/beta-hydrolase family protein [Corallococcus sp. BB11-1]